MFVVLKRQELNFYYFNLEEELEKIIDTIITMNPNQVNQYKNGKDRLFDFFVGQVMKNTKGKANPTITKELLHKKLD